MLLKPIMKSKYYNISVFSIIMSIAVFILVSHYIRNILSFVNWVTNEINRPTFFSVNLADRILIALFPISAVIGCVRLKYGNLKNLLYMWIGHFTALILFLILSFNILDIAYNTPSAPTNYVCQPNDKTLTIILISSLLLTHIINYQFFKLKKNKIKPVSIKNKKK